jgi:murein DD-endopeptidase MepM/ murein hydrolase activator NlpD
LKRKMVSVAVTMSLLASVALPATAWGLSEAEIDRQLADIQKKMKQAEASANSAAAQKRNVTAQKNREARSIQELLKQIDEQGAKLAQLNGEIADTTLVLKETGKELEQAEGRVEARDGMLQSRVRLMYTNGFVSYLEVLLQATSFSDFLDRYHALRMIIDQDKNILEANKKDRDLVVVKKQEVEAQLEQIRQLHAQASEARNQLMAQEKEKEQAVMILSKQEQEFEEISEQQEAILTELAKKRAKLYEEKQKLTYSGGKLAWPLPGQTRITSNFGGRADPFGKKAKDYHKGMDIGAPQGTTIVAAEAGTVVVAEWVNGYGNTVVINHGGGIMTWYAHIMPNGIHVDEGDSVKRGQKIASVGTTGNSTGPHLHFEVRKDSVPVDPLGYLK